MPSDSSLFSLARNKLQSVVGGNAKDSDSLHRWVLLKNSIIRTTPSPPAQSVPVKADTDIVHRRVEGMLDAEQDAFMFPDPDTLLGQTDHELGPREDQWLDSVLEDLGDDDDDDDDYDMELEDSLSASVPPMHEDDEPLSPLYSPMSSSDDLVDQSSFYYPPNFVPYPVPYPPLHPPLIPSWWFEPSASTDSLLSPSPALYHDPLPYFDTDDLEDLSVPDAIEDTSDDESDEPSTPATTSTSSLSSSTPASPLPRKRMRLLPEPRVYINKDDSFFAPFQFDPLPFPSEERPDGVRVYRRPICQEC